MCLRRGRGDPKNTWYPRPLIGFKHTMIEISGQCAFWRLCRCPNVTFWDWNQGSICHLPHTKPLTVWKRNLQQARLISNSRILRAMYIEENKNQALGMTAWVSIPMLFYMRQLPIQLVQGKLYPRQVKKIVVQLLLLYHSFPFACICQEFEWWTVSIYHNNHVL